MRFVLKYSTVFLLLFTQINSAYCDSDQAQTIDTVTLQLKWKHQFQFAGYYAAIEKGYYKDYGLYIKLAEAIEGQNPSNEVLNGNSEFGVCTSDILLMRDQNKPAVVLATIFQHSPQILIASKKSGIQHVQNLVGKRIAMEPNAADIIAFMNDEMVNLDQCIIDDHSFNTDALINGEIDAISAYLTDEIFTLKEVDFDYTIISPVAGGIDFYGDVLFTTENLINENPLMVESFLKASQKGWVYALEHSDEIIDLIYNKYSKRHNKEHLKFEARQMKSLIMADVIEIGYSNIGRWNSIANTYKRVGMLDSTFTTENLLYTDYLKDKTIINWNYISMLLAIILFIGSLAYYYYRISKKLKKAEKEIKLQNINLQRINTERVKILSIIAHDLTNPFNVIDGYSGLIKEELEDQNFSNIDSYLNHISDTSQKTQNLLQNLLDWSFSSSGKSLFNPEKFSLTELINKVIGQTNNFALLKHITIANSIQKDVDLVADKNMIKTVLRNLISNAIKFTNTGGEVKVIAATADDTITISVIDNGVGMDTDTLGKLFLSDKKISSKGTDNEKGAGLGLILCKDLIEKHDGKLWAESDIGKGSKFSFSLALD